VEKASGAPSTSRSAPFFQFLVARFARARNSAYFVVNAAGDEDVLAVLDPRATSLGVITALSFESARGRSERSERNR